MELMKSYTLFTGWLYSKINYRCDKLLADEGMASLGVLDAYR